MLASFPLSLSMKALSLCSLYLFYNQSIVIILINISPIYENVAF